MKRFLFTVIFMTIAFAASAQYAVHPTTIDIKGSRVFVDGEKLSLDSATACFSSMDGTDRSADYLAYRKGYKAGLGMTVGGATCAVVGGVAFLGSFVAALAHGLSASFAGEEVPIWVDAALYTSTAVTLGGTAVFLAGVPTLCVYKNRLNKLEKAYNGLGLTFAF